MIGGSLALALKERSPSTELRIWGRNAATLEPVRHKTGVPIVTADLATAVEGAECIVLCTPVETMADLSERILPYLSSTATVTDAGSVKGTVVTACESILNGKFIGAHPIAGSDRNGIEAARPDLYADATCVITPTSLTHPTSLATARTLWSTAGCRLVEMTPSAHDAALARTSHLPHTAASALVASIARAIPDWHTLAGGGYRDTTRIAQGHPDLWSGILLANRHEVSTAIAELIEILQNFQIALEAGEATAIHALLAEAQSQRQKLDAI